MSGYRVYEGEHAPYFLTSTVVGWASVFTSHRYFDILIDALAYCREQKQLRLYSYVLMPNHFHLIARTEEPSALSGVMRDLKRHTSRQIIRQLREDGYESLYDFFNETPMRRPGNTQAKVWQDDFHPIALITEHLYLQRLEYLEMNPVRKGYVDAPEHWRYSSARNRLLGDHSILRLDELEL
jgi:REP element-mobilizing transposase RayT